MTVKYHVNPETGRANICRAKVLCDFAVDGVEPQHFIDKTEAKAHGEKVTKEEFGGSFGGGSVSKKSEPKKYGTYDAYTENLNMKASSIRAGDVIVGEKFTNSGKWVEDNAVVKSVDTGISLTSQRMTYVKYENGNIATFNGNSPVTVKKPKGYIKGRDSVEIIRDVKSVYKQTRDNRNGIVGKENIDKLLNALNDSNADEFAADYGRRAGEIMGENSQFHDSTKVLAACERIRLAQDSDLRIHQHFDLIYDDDTPDALRKRAINESPNILETVKKVYNDRGMDWTFTS